MNAFKVTKWLETCSGVCLDIMSKEWLARMSSAYLAFNPATGQQQLVIRPPPRSSSLKYSSVWVTSTLSERTPGSPVPKTPLRHPIVLPASNMLAYLTSSLSTAGSGIPLIPRFQGFTGRASTRLNVPVVAGNTLKVPGQSNAVGRPLPRRRSVLYPDEHDPDPFATPESPPSRKVMNTLPSGSTAGSNTLGSSQHLREPTKRAPLPIAPKPNARPQRRLSNLPMPDIPMAARRAAQYWRRKSNLLLPPPPAAARPQTIRAPRHKVRQKPSMPELPVSVGPAAPFNNVKGEAVHGLYPGARTQTLAETLGTPKYHGSIIIKYSTNGAERTAVPYYTNVHLVAQVDPSEQPENALPSPKLPQTPDSAVTHRRSPSVFRRLSRELRLLDGQKEVKLSTSSRKTWKLWFCK